MRFHVAAAFSFSLCASVIVASMSMVNPALRSGPAPAAQARSRATARTSRTRLRCSASTRSTTRHAVGSLPTCPNSLP